MSWSYRKRGSVQRMAMKNSSSTATLAKKQMMFTNPQNAPIKPGPLPSGINGMCQPPRKSVTISEQPVIIAAYSPRKNSANFIDEYSVW